MPTSGDAEAVLLDTSAALALVNPDHRFHEGVFTAVVNLRRGLAGHAMFETYSVMTRQPPPHRIDPDVAQTLIASNFPDSWHLSATAAAALAHALPRLGLSGGAVYDALVAAAAREADRRLVTCDVRAVPTYAALGVRVELLR